MVQYFLKDLLPIEEIGNIEMVIKFLNSFYLNMNLVSNNSEWILWVGDQVLCRSHQKQEVEAFIYGLATCFASLPEDIANQVKEKFSQ